ncbi:hypothetical protein [Bradyrhizobium sp. BR 10261]|uniref:hypothetical protein n=1 Tax=Bradyrhizobium sp. BR 10261 TaxID=2749992 RepID=UPI001C645BA3|nr:hypothetical protein [Bradyrhizobium sp. BR 10261]MBW7962009.1 hypothetical protein [Bradyrhizobium sp. BR 10261]
MTKRISFSQLVEKIQSQRLTPQDARDYFLVEPNPHRPFDFNTYINPDNVDLKNVESLARDADQLVRHIPSPGRGKKARKGAPTKRPIVAEGDSWFRLPHVFPFPRTCIDYLQEWGYSITNLAHWGDTLDEMLLAGEFWPYVDSGYELQLFSAGGNDILGNGSLASFLNLFDVDHAKPTDAPYYVRQSFFDNLDIVVSNIETGLILPMAARHASKKIIMHGYDYVIPRPQGPWLGSPMQSRGLDPTFNAGLCQAIVRLMIDAYNTRLKALASKYNAVFTHLDLRGTVGKAEWFDELHGKDAAARKIATRFAKTLDALAITANQRKIAKTYLLERPAA